MSSDPGPSSDAGHRATRHHVLFGLLILAAVLLGARLFVFQRDCRAEMLRLARTQQRMLIPIPARRGDIYAHARNEPVLLAVSRQVPGCFADPKVIAADKLDATCTAAAEALGVSADAIRDKLTRRPEARFVWLARDLDAAAAERVRQLHLPGVGIQNLWRREYPNGSLAAHVVGFTERNGGKGLEGVERVADRYLRAVDGRRMALADAARRPIWDVGGAYKPATDGRHVELTLDVVIQRHLEVALAETVGQYEAESAVGVVVDPATGAILALANWPTYDLNAFSDATEDQRRNRALTDPYEPGSVFKPFVASVALATDAVRLGQRFDCEDGAYRCRRGRVLRDAHPYDMLTLEQVVYKSSNIGMAKVGEILGNPTLRRIVTAFGFGHATGIELPGEDGGLVRPLAQWKRDSTWSVPMGHEVSVTAVQLAMGFSALANDGLLLKPRLIQAIRTPDGAVAVDRSRPQPIRQVIDAATCRTFIRKVLARVPTDGTGRRHARLDGWSSFGKTGTARIAPYSRMQYTASYVAAAPVDDTRLVCLISVRKPDPAKGYYGGQVAGSAVKQVLDRSLAYLDVPRDIQ